MGREGTVQPPGAKLFNKQQRLMSHYSDNPEFVAALQHIEARHESVLRQALPEIWAMNIMDIAPCLEDLRELCEKWGLRCNWAALWLFDVLIQHQSSPATGYNLARIGRWDSPADAKAIVDLTWRGENVVRVEAPYFPFPPVSVPPDEEFPVPREKWGTARKGVEDEVLRQARRQMDEIERKCLQLLGWTRQDVQPSLDLHIRWLYLHICPQKDIGRPWGYQKIVDAERYGKTTVRDAVLALAHEMGISLPDLPPGQPPKYA